MNQSDATMPKVTVVLLNYNGWAVTLPCLNSLGKVSYGRFNVIVVDNASTDDSAKQLSAAIPALQKANFGLPADQPSPLAADGAIRLVQSPRNGGFAAGNNIGIRMAMDEGADLVWLLNNDTIVESDSLPLMVAALQRDAKIGAVGSEVYFMNDCQRLQAYGGGKACCVLGLSWHFSRPVRDEQLGYITGASLLLRAAALREVGLLDEGYFLYWEDVDLCYRLSEAGWKLSVAAGAKVHHMESAAAGRGITRDRFSTPSAVRFFRKHSPWPTWTILMGMCCRVAKRVGHAEFARAAAVIGETFKAMRLPSVTSKQ
jgi:GT2 family glycosyltransferase